MDPPDWQRNGEVGPVDEGSGRAERHRHRDARATGAAIAGRCSTSPSSRNLGSTDGAQVLFGAPHDGSWSRAGPTRRSSASDGPRAICTDPPPPLVAYAKYSPSCAITYGSGKLASTRAYADDAGERFERGPAGLLDGPQQEHGRPELVAPRRGQGPLHAVEAGPHHGQRVGLRADDLGLLLHRGAAGLRSAVTVASTPESSSAILASSRWRSRPVSRRRARVVSSSAATAMRPATSASAAGSALPQLGAQLPGAHGRPHRATDQRRRHERDGRDQRSGPHPSPCHPDHLSRSEGRGGRGSHCRASHRMRCDRLRRRRRAQVREGVAGQDPITHETIGTSTNETEMFRANFSQITTLAIRRCLDAKDPRQPAGGLRCVCDERPDQQGFV